MEGSVIQIFEVEKIFQAVVSQRDFDDAINSIAALQIGEHLLFDFLWSRAIKAQTVGGHVYLSALTLYRLNIACPLTAVEAVEQMSKEWDISLEEVPWYLVRQFSKETILALTENMHFENKAQSSRLSAMRHWVEKMSE